MIKYFYLVAILIISGAFFATHANNVSAQTIGSCTSAVEIIDATQMGDRDVQVTCVYGATSYTTSKIQFGSIVTRVQMDSTAYGACTRSGCTGYTWQAGSPIVGNNTGHGDFTCTGTPPPPPPAPRYRDIGLRVKQTGSIAKLAIEPDGMNSSPLMIVKNGVVYRVALVEVSDTANSTGVLIRTSGGIKAIRLCIAATCDAIAAY